MSAATPPEDPLSIQQIISRYENAEEEFLRELESMRQGANTDTSDEFAEDSPVLGTLCSLASEVRELRRQNRRLRRKLDDTPPTPLKRPSRPNSSVVHRMSQLFDGRQLLKGLMSSSSSTTSLKKPPTMQAEIRTGARERMSTPPKIDHLVVSSYSTDLSSDTGSSSNHRRKAPPLVLPEISDSENDYQQAKEGYPIDDNCLSPCYPRRSMVRRADRGSISENTSPSSVSASSSVDHCDIMTSSRSSFLELIGLKRRTPSRPEAMPTGKTPAHNKKRKRKISESDAHLANNNDKRATSNLLAVATNSEGALAPGQHDWPSGRPDSRQQVSTSLRNVSNLLPAHSASVPKFEEAEFGVKLRRKVRPKSFAHNLSPSDLNLPRSRLGKKINSSRSIASRASEDTNNSTYNVADEEFQLLQDENSFLQHEIQVLKTRNTQLIDQLRDKSMQLSKNEHIFEVKLDNFKKKEKMNEALDKVFLKEKVGQINEKSVMEIENKLKELENELQQAKNDALKSQQLAINSTFREQTAYQNCLEQVERLQRENFSLLQSKGYELGINERHIRERLEELPRYDALYAFTMRIVHRLGHLRNMLIDKSNKLIHAELELMHQQSALLVAHAQIERLKLERSRSVRRPVSFHGDDLLSRLNKPKLNVFLPFKLHGSRVEQQRKSKNNNHTLKELADDDGIEADFLKFFDMSKYPLKNDTPPSPRVERKIIPQRNNGPIENVIVYRNGRGTVSPMGSPVLAERKRIANGNASPLVRRSEKTPESGRNVRRPCSLVEAKDHNKTGEIKRLADEMSRIKPDETVPSLITNSPIMRFSGRQGHVREIVSSLQDISNIPGRSPSTTPIMVRKVPILGSPKSAERKIIRQQSCNSPNGSSYDNQPLYDCPPRGSGESSDYNSNDRPLQSCLKRNGSDRRNQNLGLPKQTHHHHHHHITSKLPQPFNLPSTPLSNGQKKPSAVLRRNSPVLQNDQRPTAAQNRWTAQRMRQSASESPRAIPRFQHNHTNLNQTIREEDERSNSLERSDQPPSSSSCGPVSRLPKPGSQGIKKPQNWFSRIVNGKK